MLSMVGGVFPAVLMCFTLFYVVAEVSRGCRLMLKLYELKNTVWGWVFRRMVVTLYWFVLSLEFFVLVWMWPGLGKGYVLSGMCLSFEQDFKHKLAGSLLS